MSDIHGRVYAYFVGTPLDTPNKVVLDISAVGTTVFTVLGWLPALSALFSIIWLGLQIWAFFEARRDKRRKAREAASPPRP